MVGVDGVVVGGNGFSATSLPVREGRCSLILFFFGATGPSSSVVSAAAGSSFLSLGVPGLAVDGVDCVDFRWARLVVELAVLLVVVVPVLPASDLLPGPALVVGVLLAVDCEVLLSLDGVEARDSFRICSIFLALALPGM